MNEIRNEIVAKHRAWNEAYLAASPEEKERMLAEKKANAEREKEERERMVYEDRKERFMQRADTQIKIYELLAEAREIAFEAIKKFDGKVLNNRLTNTLNKELKEYDNSLWAELIIEYDHNLKENVGRLKVSKSYCGSCYFNEIRINIILSPLFDGNRVMWSETEKVRNEVDYIETRIKDWKRDKKNYDKVYKEAMKIYDMIEKYGKSEFFYLRSFFAGERLVSNTYYL